MRNQVEINEAKFEGIRWKQTAGMFRGQKEVSRKPYGNFTVAFEIDSRNGTTRAMIKSAEYQPLNWSGESASYEEAVQRVAERFEQMGELIGKLEARNNEIKVHCLKLMNEAIMAMGDLNKKLEG